MAGALPTGKPPRHKSIGTLVGRGGLSVAREVMQYVFTLPWGAYSLISLYLSLASGIVVALQYDYTDPFYSVVAIDLLIPFGAFFRSLHFFSSQAFFLCGCIHLVVTYPKSSKYSRADWAILIFSMVIALLLLFTGYILRADSTGFSAGMIAEAIITTIPLLGSSINTFLFSVSEMGMQRVYVHHVITLDLLWLILAWNHLRRYRVKLADHLPLLAGTIIFCLVINAPIEPETLGTTYIAGPWFFLGLQELLRYFSPFFAGVLFPLLFLLLLLASHKKTNISAKILTAIYCWLILYLVLTVIAWLR